MLKVESFGIIPFKQESEGSWKVLLILHSKGRHWGFPKGKPNPQETAKQAAERELKEETNLVVDQFLAEDPIRENYQFIYQKRPIFKTVCYFPAIVSGKVELQVEEVREAKWMTIQEALSLLSFHEARQILLQCQKLLP